MLPLVYEKIQDLSSKSSFVRMRAPAHVTMTYDPSSNLKIRFGRLKVLFGLDKIQEGSLSLVL